MENTVKTGVDDLLDLLGHNSKIPLAEAAKKLKVPIDIVQAWVDFLVEEHVVGIEYKFTTPYIYMNKPLENPETADEQGSLNIQFFKKLFWEKAQKNNIPESKIDALWRNHIIEELELKKKYFFFEAQQRKIMNAEGIWKEFREAILSS